MLEPTIEEIHNYCFESDSKRNDIIIYSKNQLKTNGSLSYIGLDYDEKEEGRQKSLIKIHELLDKGKFSNIQTLKNYNGYIHRILENEANLAHKKKKSLVHLKISLSDGHDLPDDVGSDDSFDFDAYWKKTNECIDKLESDLQKNTARYKSDGLNYEEIAKKLDKDKINIKKYFQAAKENIRKCLEKKGISTEKSKKNKKQEMNDINDNQNILDNFLQMENISFRHKMNFIRNIVSNPDLFENAKLESLIYYAVQNKKVNDFIAKLDDPLETERIAKVYREEKTKEKHNVRGKSIPMFISLAISACAVFGIFYFYNQNSNLKEQITNFKKKEPLVKTESPHIVQSEQKITERSTNSMRKEPYNTFIPNVAFEESTQNIIMGNNDINIEAANLSPSINGKTTKGCKIVNSFHSSLLNKTILEIYNNRGKVMKSYSIESSNSFVYNFNKEGVYYYRIVDKDSKKVLFTGRINIIN